MGFDYRAYFEVGLCFKVATVFVEGLQPIWASHLKDNGFLLLSSLLEVWQIESIKVLHSEGQLGTESLAVSQCQHEHENVDSLGLTSPQLWDLSPRPLSLTVLFGLL